MMLGIAVLAVVVSGGGLVASLHVKSPAQVASEQSPPAASILTAAVRSTPLVQSVSTRGTVTAPASTDVYALSTSSELRVVTATPVLAGASVSDGSVVLQISGRPLFAMTGAVPAYRDLVAGVHGPDVRQLQAGLVAAGLLPSRLASGKFDAATQAATARFYVQAGYDPNGKGSSVTVPVAEMVFVPTLPATVSSVNVVVGSVLSSQTDPVLSLSIGQPQIASIVPAGEQPGLAVGQVVRITDDVSGVEVSGRLASIGAFSDGKLAAGTDAGKIPVGPVALAGYPCVISLDTLLDASWLGRNVRVQIVGAQTDGPVLVVPSSAVVVGPSGDAAVVVEGAGGSRTSVPVRTGMMVDGDVEVTATTAGSLVAGDTVVTG